MYKPNFVLVGGIADIVVKSEKDFIAEKQLSGDYDAIGDMLMRQFMNMKPEGESHDARSKEGFYQANPSMV